MMGNTNYRRRSRSNAGRQAAHGRHENVHKKSGNYSKNHRKIVKYRQRPKAAAFIFLLVLFYVICFITMYITKADVKTYEVDTGSLTADTVYTGLALRSEHVYASDYSGNINYYQRESGRVKKGDTIYTVDESGRVSEILSQYTQSGENSLSPQRLSSIKSLLNNFRTGYDGNNFSKIYDLKADINTAVLEAMNESIMDNIESIVASTGSEALFQTVKTEGAGIVMYYLDGYEDKTADTITHDDFDSSGYSKQTLKSNDLVVTGNPAYKMIESENWDIIIPLTQEDIDAYDLTNRTSLTIRIKKDNLTTTAAFSVIHKDDYYYGRLSLDKYMVRYAQERFLDVEIITASRTGLKIPLSAITQMPFYTIPAEYITKGGNSNAYGFICEQYADGEVQAVFVEADIYKATDTMLYVSQEGFTAGTNIIKPDSSDRFIIGATENLKGVYCINTGYTVFKLVDIIDQNNEYCISRKGVSHGISIYDRIVLDAEKYTANKMIY